MVLYFDDVRSNMQHKGTSCASFAVSGNQAASLAASFCAEGGAVLSL
jgi:hypothetical protein